MIEMLRDFGPPDRLSTGIAQLDAVLGGGIPRYSAVFVSGLPGTGKTILSQQAAFANAQAGRTCLYLTTLSEPPLKMLRFLQDFAFFQPDLFDAKVLYGDLGRALRTDGPPGLLAQMDRMVRERRPALVVIDSFKCVRDFIRDPVAFREFTIDVVVQLTTWEATALLVGEYTLEDVREGAEFAIADGIIYLYGLEEAEKQERFLRVLKMRGTSFLDGEHFFQIDAAGITLYPRLAPSVVGEAALPVGRVGSTIAGLREMLGGGLATSTATVIGGTMGAGKTVVALSFLVDGARIGEPGLLVSLEESPAQLTRNAQAFGWDLEDLRHAGLLDIYHVSPAELTIDRHAVDLLARAQQLGARRLVIDSLTAIAAAVPDMAKYQYYLWALTDYCKRHGITVIMTAEATGTIQALESTPRGISLVADTIIVLRYVEREGHIKRAVAVLKMRGGPHDTALRELLIDPPHLAVGPRLTEVELLGAAMHGP
jgi:circadian clock protein KaiC